MEDNTAKYWFSWFYKKWEKHAPGELIEQGLTPPRLLSALLMKTMIVLFNYQKKLMKKIMMP